MKTKKIIIELTPEVEGILYRICGYENSKKDLYGDFDIPFFVLTALTNEVQKYYGILDSNRFLHALAGKITVGSGE